MPGYARPVNHYATGVQFTPVGSVSATTVQAAVEEVDSEKIATSLVDAKGDLIVATAADTIARIPVSGNDGYVLMEDAAQATGVKWGIAAAGATGGGTDQVFYNNDQLITTNYSIPSGKNAGTFGPVTVNSGITVTVPAGSTWSVV